MNESSSGPGPRGKIERLLEKHGMEEFGDYLADRWTTMDSDERLSLRTLAREFNVRLLELRLAAVNADPVEGTAESYYESLTGDNASRGVRTQARRSLEQAGVDADEVEAEFVSRQAIHTYLTKTRDVSQSESNPSISVSSVQETINRLRERTRQVTVSRLDRLRGAGELTIGEFRVIVDIQVYCTDCEVQQSVSGLLRAGTCACQDRD